MKKILLTIFAAATAVVAQALPLPPVYGDTIRIKTAIDTLDTGDKYKKVVLFDDNTWQYYELDRPNISDEDFEDNWDIESIHICKDIPVSSLPEEVDLVLTDSTHGYSAPITGRVSSGFKFRRTRNHNGTDIVLNVGDTIRAAFDGKVRVVRTVGHAGGYGNLMVIRHANGLETYYAHLSGFIADENEIVKAGEPVALGGNTGRSTGDRKSVV